MADHRGVQKIREQVLAQAEQEAKQIRERAGFEAERMKREADKQIERIRAEAKAESEAFQSQQQRRTDSMSRLDQRRVALTARQELLGEAVDEALKRLKQADPAKKAEIYRTLLPKNPARGTIATAAKGERGILQKAVRGAGLSENVRVAEEEGSFEGGFILRNGPVTDNLTFDALFAVKEDELRTEAARILFRQDEAEVGADASEPAADGRESRA